jgi:predicted Ser/Thr protein kinase
MAKGKFLALENVFPPAAGRMFQRFSENSRDVLLVPYKLLPGYAFRHNEHLRRTLGGLVILFFICLFNGNFEADFPIFTSLFFFFLCSYLSLSLRRDALYFDNKLCFLPGNTNRLGRIVTKIVLGTMSFSIPVSWAKLVEIAIIDKAKGGKKRNFVLRLVTAQARGSLKVNFDLSLAGFERTSLPALVAHLEKYASHARGIYLLKELERFHDYQMGLLPQLSYTELWESTNKSAFSLTSFNPLAPGTKIQNNAFTVERQIAAGGFSAVYLIVSQDGERFVLKESCLPLSLSADNRSKALEQFKREALLLAKLEHPQIAQVYDHFTENDRNYMRLEYLRGQTLRERISKYGIEKEETVRDWFQQLAKIVIYLHGLEPPVVHRDLAPDNIIIQENGQLCLIDFGAANEFVGAATGTLVGRHAYMATEQIRGKAEPRSDLYSLGATMYFCLTNQEPQPLRTSSPKKGGLDVSDAIDQIVTKCTQLEANQRFNSAGELLNSLKGKNLAERQIPVLQ